MANPWIFALIKAIVANCHQLATAAVFTCPGSGVNHPPTHWPSAKNQAQKSVAFRGRKSN